MSSFSVNTLAPHEIINVLSTAEIANLTPESLSNPTSDLVCSLYLSILSYMDPLMDDPGQADFAGLDFIEDLDAHNLSVKITNLYKKMKNFISTTCAMNFTMKDLIRPKRDRTLKFLSGIIHFMIYRDDKLSMIRSMVEHTSDQQMSLMEVETRKSELNREIAELEDFDRMEQPIVDELQAEVNLLHKTTQTLNKQQRSIRSSLQKLLDDAKDVDVKISSTDLKLVELVQLNSSLHSSIVQSPQKLQNALEEKKSIRAEVSNSESLAMQGSNEKKTKLEVYCEAAKKLYRHAEKMQALQEQLSSVKNAEKEVKVLKKKMANEEMTFMSLEAKTVEAEGRAKKASDLESGVSKEKNVKTREIAKELKDLKLSSEAKMHEFSLREQNAQAKIRRAESISLETKTMIESGLVAQQKLCARSEEIMEELKNYFILTDPVLAKFHNGFGSNQQEIAR